MGLVPTSKTKVMVMQENEYARSIMTPDQILKLDTCQALNGITTNEQLKLNSDNTTKGVPKLHAHELVKNAFLNTFEDLGGEAWLKEWAECNQTEFVRLFAKMLPTKIDDMSQGSGVVIIQNNVPKSPLDF